MLALGLQCGLVSLGIVAPPWVVERLQPHGLELATFPGTGRGLRTTRPRVAGDLLFSVNDCDLLIAERLVENHPVLRAAAKAAAAAGGPLTDEQLISLYLAMEDTVPYVAALPPQHSVLSLPAELCALLPRCYARVVAATREYALGLHRSACAALVAAGAPPVELDAFLWAFATVRSRSVEVDDDDGGGVPTHPLVAAGGQQRRRALFPVLDLFNHRSGARSKLARRGEVWGLTSRDEYTEGEQAFISYGGELDNLHLLLTYGFALADNPHPLLLFGTAELLAGCAMARPELFSPEVVELLAAQLEQAATLDAARLQP